MLPPKRIAFRTMPDFSPLGWVRTLRQIEKLDFDRVIPGHGPSTTIGRERQGNPFLK